MLPFDMSTVCEFMFDRPNAVLYSGDKITGKIVLKTTSAKAVSGIYILFVGLARVAFDDTRSAHTSDELRNERFVSTAVETYMRYQQNVAERGQLSEGTHTYTFSIALPAHCPTSCLGKYGKVSYELSLVINRLMILKKVFRKPLAVLQPYDLNLHPEMLRPIELERTRKFCCWPFGGGSVKLKLHIPFGGYVPGQTINYSLDVDNMSQNVDLKAFMMTLIQTYTFKVENTRRVVHTYMRGNRETQRVAHQTKRKLNGSYEVPTVQPSSQGPHIIDISYKLRLTVIFTGFHLKWNIETPITIGTIPLKQSGNRDQTKEFVPDAEKISKSQVDRPALYTSTTLLFQSPEKIRKHFVDPHEESRNRSDDFIPIYTVYAYYAQPRSSLKRRRGLTPNKAKDSSSETASEKDMILDPDQTPKKPTN